MNDLNANDGHGKMYSFHGLGWDGGTDGSGSSQTFKLFIMYHNYNQLASDPVVGCVEGATSKTASWYTTTRLAHTKNLSTANACPYRKGKPQRVA